MSERKSLTDLMESVKREQEAVQVRVAKLVAMKSVAHRFPAIPPSSPGTFFVHRDPARNDCWRVTKLDLVGVPTGHVETGTKGEALVLADELGADLFCEQFDVMATSEARAIGLVSDGAPPTPAPTGAKHDAGKERYDLIPPGVLCDLARVLTHGAKVYAPENWRKVPNPEARYYAAAMRHLEAWRMGAKVDPDSQLPHLAHALCCITFLAAFSSGEARPAPPPTPADEDQDVIAYMTSPRTAR